MDVIELVARLGTLNSFFAALRAAEMTELLRRPGRCTVFAPTDEAFRRIPSGSFSAVLESPGGLGAMLSGHVVPETVTAAMMRSPGIDSVCAFNGLRLSIRLDGEAVRVGQARVTSFDLRAENGIIHIVDEVLLLDLVVASPETR